MDKLASAVRAHEALVCLPVVDALNNNFRSYVSNPQMTQFMGFMHRHGAHIIARMDGEAIGGSSRPLLPSSLDPGAASWSYFDSTFDNDFALGASSP